MRRIFAMPIRGRSVNDKSWRCIVVTKSLLVGRATKPVGYREHIVCNVGCEEERARKTSWRIASPRNISRGSTRVFCVVCSLLDRYHLRFFSPALSLPLSFCRLRRVLVSLPIYSPFPPSSLSSAPFSLSARRWGGALKCRRPDTYSFNADAPSYNAKDCSVLLAISILCCRQLLLYYNRLVEYRDTFIIRPYFIFDMGGRRHYRYFILDISHVSLWAVYIKHKFFNKCISP